MNKHQLKDTCSHTLVINPNTRGKHHYRYYTCEGCGENFFDNSQLTFKLQELVNKRLATQAEKQLAMGANNAEQ